MTTRRQSPLGDILEAPRHTQVLLNSKNSCTSCNIKLTFQGYTPQVQMSICGKGLKENLGGRTSMALGTPLAPLLSLVNSSKTPVTSDGKIS